MEQVRSFIRSINLRPGIFFSFQGSGKTRVLTCRIAYLLKHCNAKPYQIFAVTFTNKAALEMRHRISQILPGISLNDMWLGTFHGLGNVSFCSIDRWVSASSVHLISANRFLRLHGKLVGLPNDFLIIDPDDQLAIVKKILKDEIRENHFFTDKPKALVNFINKSKDDGKRAADIIIKNDNRFQQLIYSKYEKHIRDENQVDFGELILLTKGSFEMVSSSRSNVLL